MYRQIEFGNLVVSAVIMTGTIRSLKITFIHSKGTTCAEHFIFHYPLSPEAITPWTK